MAIQFPCPHCGEVMTIPERFAGSSRICPNCRGQLSAPQGTTANRSAADGSSSSSSKANDDLADNRTQDARNSSGTGSARLSRLAICGILSAIASLPLFFMAVPGLLLGFIARGRIRRSDGRLRGIGLAWTAIALSIVSLIFYSTFVMTLGHQVRQTAEYAYGRFVTQQRMSDLHKGMQAALVRNVVLPKTLASVASRGKLPPESARPAIGDADFVYLGAGRTADAMNAEHVLLYWPLLTESGQVLCLFGDGDVRSLSTASLNLLLQRQGNRCEALKQNDLLPEELLKWLREMEHDDNMPDATPDAA